VGRPDGLTSESRAGLSAVLEDIAALRAEGRRVLVHCRAGASRTGLALRAWPMREEADPAHAATGQVAAA